MKIGVNLTHLTKSNSGAKTHFINLFEKILNDDLKNNYYFFLPKEMKLRELSFLKRNNWSLTIVGTYNEYRHRLRLFQRFVLQTKVLGYDEKWFYFFQRVERKGKTHMASVVKFAYTSNKGLVHPKEVVSAMGIKYEPNRLPSWIKELTEHQLFKK